MKKMLPAALLMGSLSLAGCGSMNNQDTGTLTGGVIGGLIGSQFGSGSGKVLAAAGGALAGAYIGNQIGRTMDRQDEMMVQRSLNQDRPADWVNPNTGNHYVVTPQRTYHQKYRGHRRTCREYITTAMIGGKRQQIYGRACRMADGSWRVVK